jgi:hypothetical protein
MKINFEQLAKGVIKDLTKNGDDDIRIAVVEFDTWFVQFGYSDAELLYWFAEKHNGDNLHVDNHVLIGAEYLTDFPVTVTMIAYIIKSIYEEVEHET